MAAIIFAQKQFTHYCKRIFRSCWDLSKFPKNIAEMTSIYAHCRRWQEQPHQILFSQSLHHLVHIWARLYEGRGEAEEGSRGSPLSGREGRPPIMLPPVPFVHAEDDPGAGGGQKTVKHSSFSSFGSSIHPSISGGSFWMKVVTFGNFCWSSVPPFDFASIMISSPL